MRQQPGRQEEKISAGKVQSGRGATGGRGKIGRSVLGSWLTVLRHAIKKATSATRKEIAAMLESAVKLKALMASPSLSVSGPSVRFTDENVFRFERFIKGERVEVRPAAAVLEASLGGAKADALESPPEGAPTDVTEAPESA